LLRSSLTPLRSVRDDGRAGGKKEEVVAAAQPPQQPFINTRRVVIPNEVRNPEGLAEGNLILLILNF
jgi:hypothetical protein